ncbi:MAG: hypothetical protein ABI746_06260 [Dermatophilaceae bacterium]
MVELSLTRSVDDPKRYELPGVGSLRRPHWYTRRTQARTIDGREWTLMEKGFWGSEQTATDSYGTAVGVHRRRGWTGRDGTLTWQGRAYETRTAGWKLQTEVRGEGRVLLTARPGAWRPKRVMVTLDETAGLDDGLILFATWLAQTEQERRSSAAAST